MQTKHLDQTREYRPIIISIPTWLVGATTLAWFAASVMNFIPFARNTSAWDALTLHVPGHQGNWWHVLVGLPFFMAFPMLWLNLRILFSQKQSKTGIMGPHFILAIISGICTALVEVPFIAQRAGTSGMQRFEVIILGLGILSSGIWVLCARRKWIDRIHANLLGLSTAYLANLAICQIIYSEATGNAWSRAGWLASTVLIFPIGAEWLCLMMKMQSLQATGVSQNPHPA